MDVRVELPMEFCIGDIASHDSIRAADAKVTTRVTINRPSDCQRREFVSPNLLAV